MPGSRVSPHSPRIKATVLDQTGLSATITAWAKRPRVLAVRRFSQNSRSFHATSTMRKPSSSNITAITPRRSAASVPSRSRTIPGRFAVSRSCLVRSQGMRTTAGPWRSRGSRPTDAKTHARASMGHHGESRSLWDSGDSSPIRSRASRAPRSLQPDGESSERRLAARGAGKIGHESTSIHCKASFAGSRVNPPRCSGFRPAQPNQ